MEVTENRLMGHGKHVVRKIEGNQPNDRFFTFAHILVVTYFMGEIEGEEIKDGSSWFFMKSA